MSMSPAWSLYMSKSRPFGWDGSVLLSVVAQAFLIDLLCAGDPSLSFGDANGDYQWEVQTSEG
jgi:hypothetical protein